MVPGWYQGFGWVVVGWVAESVVVAICILVLGGRRRKRSPVVEVQVGRVWG